MSAPVKQLGIVVAVDGSPASNAAVCWAARDAAMRNIALTVVHAVVTPTVAWPPVPYPDSLAVRLDDEGKRAVMHAVKIAEDAMPTDRKVTINRELVYSTPALALIKMSDEAEMMSWVVSVEDCWPAACSVRSVRPWRGTRIVPSQSSATKIS
jgi:nucleotide-binding universal stress UspA family protein